MRADDPNLPYLRHIAEALGELREQVVFVGGAVAGLLVTDPLADAVRATRDVDAVVNASRAMFHRIEEAVAERGFARDISSDVICRWVHKDSGVLFDLMPVQPEVLGFSNRWYPYAVETAVSLDLGSGLTIRLVSAVAFVATKLEAFAGRGNGDFMSSHDLEDVLNIVDGREELAEEMAAAPAELRRAVATAFAQLLKNPDFVNVLPGLIADPERAGLVTDRLKALSQ
ncbi:nucleotidyl transferase AbiEii/AbiGii toxin family protein [Paucibacter sediminis]|uniref:Nucleotidyl transferase AbiEii/AbiGii toxin family protein n=1 Tax=Paucibacter sediminis TaxID=3019553 RepID=A0AA95NER2_9BURK|nr:nucleotidyl transferase AbiEii/AbiGii toxin family protein [Paucibacter sp. S2-9]WIT12253.1 nucleotidyl transferase AbiEii/AbiGii toxin family protein [Paucibacter sp. S2-9]